MSGKYQNSPQRVSAVLPYTLVAEILHLFRFTNAPGCPPTPAPKPVCRQFSRCEGCPYPAHGFLCWGSQDDCMRTRMKKVNEKETEHED